MNKFSEKIDYFKNECSMLKKLEFILRKSTLNDEKEQINIVDCSKKNFSQQTNTKKTAKVSNNKVHLFIYCVNSRVIFYEFWKDFKRFFVEKNNHITPSQKILIEKEIENLDFEIKKWINSSIWDREKTRDPYEYIIPKNINSLDNNKCSDRFWTYYAGDSPSTIELIEQIRLNYIKAGLENLKEKKNSVPVITKIFVHAKNCICDIKNDQSIQSVEKKSSNISDVSDEEEEEELKEELKEKSDIDDSD